MEELKIRPTAGWHRLSKIRMVLFHYKILFLLCHALKLIAEGKPYFMKKFQCQSEWNIPEPVQFYDYIDMFKRFYHLCVAFEVKAITLTK